jgi:hypothetical protein
MSSYIINSRSDNTAKSYYYSFNRWSTFAKKHSFDVLSAQSVHIALFITHLLDSGATHNTVNSIQWTNNPLGWFLQRHYLRIVSWIVLITHSMYPFNTVYYRVSASIYFFLFAKVRPTNIVMGMRFWLLRVKLSLVHFLCLSDMLSCLVWI